MSGKGDGSGGCRCQEIAHISPGAKAFKSIHGHAATDEVGAIANARNGIGSRVEGKDINPLAAEECAGPESSQLVSAIAKVDCPLSCKSQRKGIDDVIPVASAD